MSRAGPSNLAGTNKRPRLVSHKSGSPATADTPKQEHESEAQQIASAPEQYFYAPTALGEVVDRAARAALARFTFGFSPAALAECYLDFATRRRRVSSCSCFKRPSNNLRDWHTTRGNARPEPARPNPSFTLYCRIDVSSGSPGNSGLII